VIICADARQYLKGCIDGEFGCVITDPPEEISGDMLHELLRVSAGPVVMLSPLVWFGEPRPRSMRLPVEPDDYEIWVTEHPEIGTAWGSIYVWRQPDGLPAWDPPVIPVPWAKSEDKINRIRKPDELMDLIVKRWARGTVLDPYCGSGSTLGAAWRAGLCCCSIDIDPDCCDAAARRESCCSSR
jgi:hypothetical protein